jgi:hypothetical protein
MGTPGKVSAVTYIMQGVYIFRNYKGHEIVFEHGCN